MRGPSSRSVPARVGCEDPRPHARKMCAACLYPCVSLSRATPRGLMDPHMGSCSQGQPSVPGGEIRAGSREREFFIDNLLVRIHFIIVMIRWTGLAPWEFEFPFKAEEVGARSNSRSSKLKRCIPVSQDHSIPGVAHGIQLRKAQVAQVRTAQVAQTFNSRRLKSHKSIVPSTSLSCGALQSAPRLIRLEPSGVDLTGRYGPVQLRTFGVASSAHLERCF